MNDVSEHCLCDHCSGQDCNPFTAEELARQQDEHDAAIRKDVLNELGTMLNSRISKMEIICSKSKTPLREGILMAYREIEGWEMQQRNSIVSTPEDAGGVE